ncbi:serine/threonine protein kinase [Thiomicrospira microaerophila]|uniref:serine/threonine protein kinase n=1 Tax=Thiomicrospira microaerophila TaxID=406020 RepID=UPI000697D578|nr:serine/threonine-protein kinase [Thiomicrospira microaerophila]
MHNRNTLPVGSKLDKYLITGVLGVGGFGVTYKAKDEAGTRVAIKEYLPAELSYRDQKSESVRPRSKSDFDDFMWGLRRFKDEAFSLVRFEHPSIVKVQRYFETNNTAYIVMPFYPGKPLAFYIKQGVLFNPEEAEFMFDYLMQGLTSVHKTGMVHRDIKPDNILLLDSGFPLLLDFGAARQRLGEHSQQMTRVLTPPYAAYEQYISKSHVGCWTDYYGLSATFYECITGQKPLDGMERFVALHDGDPDPLVPIPDITPYAHNERFIEILMNGLAVNQEHRPRSYEEWKSRVSRTSKTQYLKW